MKRYIAFRLSFASVFEAVVANYNLARDSKISVEYAAPNAVEFISVETEEDMAIIKNLMVQYEGEWADELPPPTQFRNPMPDMVGNCNSTGWKRKIREYERGKAA